jgi:predicted DNA-binding ribbon-helix-helix protein
VRSLSSAVEVACRRWLAERGKEKGPHVAAR